MKKNILSLFFAAGVAALLSFVSIIGVDHAVAADGVDDNTFVLGRITDNPKKHHAAMEEMSGYILDHIKDLGYRKAEVMMVKSIDKMVGLLGEGKVDALSETPFGASRLIDEAGGEALLREWKKGVSSYRPIFFTAADSGIASLEDLRGKSVVFEDRGSTTGFLLPLAMLHKAGIETVELGHLTDQPPSDKVGYFFSDDEMSQLLLVSRGTAAAGAFSNLDWAEYQETKVLQNKLRLFHEGDMVMRSVFVVRGGLKDKVKGRIAETLQDMMASERGRSVLKKYNKVKKYDQPSPKEIAQGMDYIRSMSKMLSNAMKQ